MSEESSPPPGTLEEALGPLVEAWDEQNRQREEAFQKLYAELSDYRDQAFMRAGKTVLLDLLVLHDSLQWFHQRVLDQLGEDAELTEVSRYLVDELLEVLYRQDVLPMESSERFDKSRHRAIQVQWGDKLQEDQRVVRVLKRGFMRGEELLRAEEIVVYRYQAGTGGEAT